MEILYITIGILIFSNIVFLILSYMNYKKSLKLSDEVKAKHTKLEELYKDLQHEKTENKAKEEKISNLNDYKENYLNLEKELIETKELLKEAETKYKNGQNRIDEQKETIKELNDFIKQLDNENKKLSVENQELKTKLDESQKSFEEKIEYIKRSEEKLKESFENLASKILDETNEKMTKTSKENISQLLQPLQNQIKEFKEKIENLSKNEAEKISALQNELKNLKELSYQLSVDAENLTKALKGESKTQGNWGELVLERVLELSGLEKGREYEREVNLHDEDNKRYRPDVIVHLPNQRDVIIDAKTSLNAYQEYINTEDKKFIRAHIQALKNHIDMLADKKYESLQGVNSLDFVFMFVPIENALMLALENDTTLFEYAFKKRVILVSPTTLLVSLRAIESSWRFEKQAKNIDEIVKSAENLYDKVRGFTEDFEKIGKSLETAQKSFDNAKNKLTSGKGNIIRQIEILKHKAGIKPKKEIAKELTDRALIETSETN